MLQVLCAGILVFARRNNQCVYVPAHHFEVVN
jgi:hypothetical protein